MIASLTVRLICGVAGSGCVESVLRDAPLPNYSNLSSIENRSL
jgi:hypothetical protein